MQTRYFYLIIVLLFWLAACGSSTSNTGTAATSTPASAATTATPTASNQHFKVGQVVKVGDTWQVTISSVKPSQGGQYFKPKAGMVWLIFSITVKNISTSEQNISSELNFHLQDVSGQKYTETIDPDAGATLDGKVEVGSPSKGVIVYEVPPSTHDYQLAFEPDITASGQTIWDIKV